MTRESRPQAAPQLRASDASSSSGWRIRGPRWWDDPGALPDDELMRVARSMLAVDRAVDRFRGRRWAA